VRCKKGTKTVDVTVPNDPFWYSAFYTTGTKYKNNQQCTGVYTLGEGCSRAMVDCWYFYVKCNKGDVLTISDSAGNFESYCGDTGPYYSPVGDFTMTFTSDGSKRDYGLFCDVTCSDGGSGESTTEDNSGTESTTEDDGGNESTTQNNGGGGETSDCFCGLAQRTTRIVGGTVTEVNEYPWQAGLVSAGTSNKVYCGGALINNQWVLTAAHCTVNLSPSGVQVLLGEHDIETTAETDRIRANIIQIVDHPTYNQAAELDKDFSLLKLAEPIIFSDHPHIRPICLPENDNEDYNNFDATITGWGTTSFGGVQSAKLQEVIVQVTSNSICQSKYLREKITDQMLCAGVNGGGKDSCQGDSGGPLFTSGSGNGETAGQNYEHIGVVSWGYGCASASYPGVYARTSKQLSWIAKTTSGASTCPRQ